MRIPQKEAFEADAPSLFGEWEFEQQYETSFLLVNKDNGEQVRGIKDKDRGVVRLIPMVQSGMGYSSIQDEAVEIAIEDEEEIVSAEWDLAKKK